MEIKQYFTWLSKYQYYRRDITGYVLVRSREAGESWEFYSFSFFFSNLDSLLKIKRQIKQ